MNWAGFTRSFALALSAVGYMAVAQGCGTPTQAANPVASPPSVVSTSPSNGDTNVDPRTRQISVQFSQPMQSGWSFVVSPHGKTPALARPTLSPDKRTITADVVLEPGTTYALWLNSPSHRNFISAKGRPAAPYHYEFSTSQH